MSGIKTGRIDKGRYHEYYVDGIKVPGVTTLLNSGLPKPALINWSGNTVAEYAIDNWRPLSKLPPSQRLKELKGSPHASNDKAKAKGTSIHTIAEKLNHGETVDTIPAGLDGYIASCRAFLNDWNIEPIHIELPVFSRAYSFGGTIDLIAKAGSKRLVYLLDWKTGSGVYSEPAYQMTAYKNADFYLDGDAETPLPHVDRCAAIHLTPSGYSVWELQADEDEVFDEFLHIMAVSQAIKSADGYLVEVEKVAV
jgi:hypothetical protein